MFAWAYITLCFLTLGLLADASMVLSDNSVFSKDIVIIPSNRKIRIYNYKEGYVDSYLKDGFNDYYLKKEIEVRKAPDFDFILPLIKYGDRWYREKLLQGRCLVRISGDIYQKYLDNVLCDLRTYYKKSTTQISAKDYLLQLLKEYRIILDRIIDKKNITCGEKIKNVLAWAEHFAQNTTKYISVTVGHGDLQTGNIFVDKEYEKVYLIDWETAKLRSIWYDAATVLCEIRRKGKFSYMINHCNDQDVKNRILYFEKNKACDMKVVTTVLIIEELGFFLEEITDLPGAMGSEIIERYEYEIDHIDFLK